MQDVKALKRRVEVSFPDLFPDDIDLLFPAKVPYLHQDLAFSVHQKYRGSCRDMCARSLMQRGEQTLSLCAFEHMTRAHCAIDDVQSEVQLIKMKNRATAYTCNGPSPLFFDPEGRGDLLVPTCYAMWRFPRILDKLYTYSEVSPKVCQSEVHAPTQLHHRTFASLGFLPSVAPCQGHPTMS